MNLKNICLFYFFLGQLFSVISTLNKHILETSCLYIYTANICCLNPSGLQLCICIRINWGAIISIFIPGLTLDKLNQIILGLESWTLIFTINQNKAKQKQLFQWFWCAARFRTNSLRGEGGDILDDISKAHQKLCSRRKLKIAFADGSQTQQIPISLHPSHFHLSYSASSTRLVDTH